MQMNTSFAVLRKTPEMLARQVARQVLQSAYADIAAQRRPDLRRIFKLADSAGRGAEMVRREPEFQAAVWLAT